MARRSVAQRAALPAWILKDDNIQMLVKAFIDTVEGDVNLHIGYGHHTCAIAANMGIGKHPFQIGIRMVPLPGWMVSEDIYQRIHSRKNLLHLYPVQVMTGLESRSGYER